MDQPKKYRVTGTKDGKPVSAIVASRTMEGACGHAEKAGIKVSGAIEVRGDEPPPTPLDATREDDRNPIVTALGVTASAGVAACAWTKKAVGNWMEKERKETQPKETPKIRGAICRVCDSPSVRRMRRPKHGWLLQNIGQLLILIGLIPVIVFGVVPMVGAGGITAQSKARESEMPAAQRAEEILLGANVPGEIRAMMLQAPRQMPNEETLATLTEPQQQAVIEAGRALTLPGTEAAAAALVATAGAAGIFTGCCGGLIPIVIGLLLARKETVLMCSSCRAVVAFG